MFNSALNYLYGVDGGGIYYTGNNGGASATPTANTPLPNQYNNTPTRGGQAALGFYSNNNGMTFSPDGTRAYSVNHNGVSEGFTNDAVTQYNLSTPWDLLTMGGFVSATISLNSFPSFTDTSPHSCYFSPDGFNLYVTGTSSDRIYRFTLGTAYELSTSSANSSFASGYASLLGISFSTDGLKMFITEGAFLRRFTLSVAWDITTATNDAMSKAIYVASQVYFKSDGLSFFTYGGAGGGTRLGKYYLTTPWDLSTYIATEYSIDLNTLTFTLGGTSSSLYFSPDGLYFFSNGYTGYSIKRFELKRGFKIN